MITQEILVYTILALIFSILLLIIWLIRIQSRLKKILRGKKIDIEDSLLDIYRQLKNNDNFKHNSELRIKSLENKIQKSIRSIKTIRFNPFKGTGEGGNQSFSTTFVDEYGNGIVLTGLYHRERISIFAKPILNWESEYELSVEEKKALNSAKEDYQE